MILSALTRLYDALVEKGKLDKPGWLKANVSYCLVLNEEGELVRVVPLSRPEARGKKEVMAPRRMVVPAPVKRSSGVAPNFLCDFCSYFLGIDAKGKPERTRKCFEESRKLHETLLSDCDAPVAKAVLRFFARWEPDKATQHPALSEHLEGVVAGGNLVFQAFGCFAQDDPAVKAAWDRAYEQADTPIIRCLVTGEEGPLAVLHPALKGIIGAQPTGASLVSFNAPAFESYDHEQGMNAPVSTRAAFAYGAALNYLLASDRHRMRVGDTTVVFWAENAEEQPCTAFSMLVGREDAVEQDDLQAVISAIANGEPARLNGKWIDPQNPFYVLGLSPNAARASVRFFLNRSFGTFIKNIQAHYERLEIVRPAYEKDMPLYPWRLLSETVNPKATDKTPLPQLSGALFNAILSGGLYPATLLTQTEIRIRAEQRITYGRAAILKAYLLANVCQRSGNEQMKEAVSSVKLNEETTYQPYLLGRLFAALEGLQIAVNPDLNTTIRDRYFNSACSTPAVIFPMLIKLAQAHLRKPLNDGWAVKERNRNEELIRQLIAKIGDDYPKHLNLPDQGIFQIGYYHQTQKRYEKKEASVQ